VAIKHLASELMVHRHYLLISPNGKEVSQGFGILCSRSLLLQKPTALDPFLPLLSYCHGSHAHHSTIHHMIAISTVEDTHTGTGLLP